VRNDVRCEPGSVVEKVVKWEKGAGLMQVVENGERINFKTCHSWAMQCDIMLI
jgi:hypothetical protein